MEVLNEETSLERFWERVAAGPDRTLLLDYDGTLAPFREERDQAVPYPGVPERIDALLASGLSRVVIVSGRGVEDLQPLLGLEGRPEIWGCHGWEQLLPDGRYRIGELGEAERDALERATRWAEERLDPSRCERKPASVAYHWRGLEQDRRQGIQSRLGAKWGPLAEKTGLELHHFDGGLELRHPGRDKGYAVREILAGSKADAPVAFLGDDRTDEDAFAALGEGGLAVLVRQEFRQTGADLWLQPPEELLEFLDLWRNAEQGGD